jgi:hypothetical protein
MSGREGGRAGHLPQSHGGRHQLLCGLVDDGQRHAEREQRGGAWQQGREAGAVRRQWAGRGLQVQEGGAAVRCNAVCCLCVCGWVGGSF